jgi:hypothetical protein
VISGTLPLTIHTRRIINRRRMPNMMNRRNKKRINLLAHDTPPTRRRRTQSGRSDAFMATSAYSNSLHVKEQILI